MFFWTSFKEFFKDRNRIPTASERKLSRAKPVSARDLAEMNMALRKELQVSSAWVGRFGESVVAVIWGLGWLNLFGW